MKILVKIVDINNYMSTINVFRVTKSVSYLSEFPIIIPNYELLEQMPYMQRSEVFENAVALSCRLRSAGFDVIMERGEENESEEKTNNCNSDMADD